ncbi:MAG: hypothetical protein ACK58C_02145, partial [Betaproteobacteria bacterium]
ESGAGTDTSRDDVLLDPYRVRHSDWASAVDSAGIATRLAANWAGSAARRADKLPSMVLLFSS